MNLFKNRPSKQMPPNEHLHMENYPLPFKYEAPFQEIISTKNKISKTAIKICVSLIKQKWKITQQLLREGLYLPFPWEPHICSSHVLTQAIPLTHRIFKSTLPLCSLQLWDILLPPASKNVFLTKQEKSFICNHEGNTTTTSRFVMIKLKIQLQNTLNL